MFKVYHVDIHNKTLLNILSNRDEAVTYVLDRYKGRFRPDRTRDEVRIESESGSLDGSWGVEWGMTFVAVKKWGPFKSSSAGKPQKPRKDGKPARKVLDEYYVQLNDTGILSCQCMGWAIYKNKPRECTHTKKIAAEENLPLTPLGQYWFVDNEKLKKAKVKWGGLSVPERKLMDLIADYEKVVRKMAALDPIDMFAMAEEVQLAKFRVEAWIDQLEEVGPEALDKLSKANDQLEATWS
jgi:hypothetical protein